MFKFLFLKLPYICYAPTSFWRSTRSYQKVCRTQYERQKLTGSIAFIASSWLLFKWAWTSAITSKFVLNFSAARCIFPIWKKKKSEGSKFGKYCAYGTNLKPIVFTMVLTVVWAGALKGDFVFDLCSCNFSCRPPEGFHRHHKNRRRYLQASEHIVSPTYFHFFVWILSKFYMNEVYDEVNFLKLNFLMDRWLNWKEMGNEIADEIFYRRAAAMNTFFNDIFLNLLWQKFKVGSLKAAMV